MGHIMSRPTTVSVVLPTLNGSRFIRRTIGSILDNDYPQFELIVVDQSPNDHTECLINGSFSNDPRLIYVHTDKVGSSYARNVGIHRASGELIVFTDDDVVVSRGWIQAYVTCYTQLMAAGMTPGVMGGPVEGLWERPRPSWWPQEFSYLICELDMGSERKPYEGGLLPFTANMCAPKAILLEVSGFKEGFGPTGPRTGRVRLLSGEDTLCVLRISRLGYSLYYEPAAKVHHIMVKERLTREYFLRRIFWEGANQVNVSLTLDPASRKVVLRRLCSQLKRLVTSYGRMAGARINFGWTNQASYMLELGKSRLAMGQLYWLSKTLGFPSGKWSH